MGKRIREGEDLARKNFPTYGKIIEFDCTSNKVYDVMKTNAKLDSSTFYITSTAQTIVQMLPSNIYLNYMNVCGFIEADNYVATKERLVQRGFVPINEAENNSSSNLTYVEDGPKTKFITLLSPGENYFSLYVPVDNRYTGEDAIVKNNVQIEILNNNNPMPGVRIEITGLDENNDPIYIDSENMITDMSIIGTGESVIVQSTATHYTLTFMDIPAGTYTISEVSIPENYFNLDNIVFTLNNGNLSINSVPTAINKIILNYTYIRNDLIDNGLCSNLDARDLTINSTSWVDRTDNQNDFYFGGVGNYRVDTPTLGINYETGGLAHNERYVFEGNTFAKLPTITTTSYNPNTTCVNSSIYLDSDFTLQIYFTLYAEKLSDMFTRDNNNYIIPERALSLQFNSTDNYLTSNMTDFIPQLISTNTDNTLDITSIIDLKSDLSIYLLDNMDLRNILPIRIGDVDTEFTWDYNINYKSENTEIEYVVSTEEELPTFSETIENTLTYDSVTNDVIFTEPINKTYLYTIVRRDNTLERYIDNQLVFSNNNLPDDYVVRNISIGNRYCSTFLDGIKLGNLGCAYIHTFRAYYTALTLDQIEQNLRYERTTPRNTNIINEPIYLNLSAETWESGSIDTLTTVYRSCNMAEYINIGKYIQEGSKFTIKVVRKTTAHIGENTDVDAAADTLYKFRGYFYDSYCNVVDETYGSDFFLSQDTMTLCTIPNNSSIKYIRLNIDSNSTESNSIEDLYIMMYIYNPSTEILDEPDFFNDRNITNNISLVPLLGTYINNGNVTNYSNVTDPTSYTGMSNSAIDQQAIGYCTNTVFKRSAVDNISIANSFKYHNYYKYFKISTLASTFDSDVFGIRYKIYFYDANSNYLDNITQSLTYDYWLSESDYIAIPYTHTEIDSIVVWAQTYIKSENLLQERYGSMQGALNQLYVTLVDGLDSESINNISYNWCQLTDNTRIGRLTGTFNNPKLVYLRAEEV